MAHRAKAIQEKRKISSASGRENFDQSLKDCTPTELSVDNSPPLPDYVVINELTRKELILDGQISLLSRDGFKLTIPTNKLFEMLKELTSKIKYDLTY